VPEIFAAGALDLIDGLRATRCFIQNFGGERMREMMLADDDLGINADIAGTPENFDDTAGRPLCLRADNAATPRSRRLHPIHPAAGCASIGCWFHPSC